MLTAISTPTSRAVPPLTSPRFNDFSSRFKAADKATLQGYISGEDIALNAASVQALYQNVASGAIAVTPDQFGRLLQPNSDTKGIDITEFSALSSDVQAWAKNNPQQFFTGLLGHRNPANNDLASIGAEGGISSLGDIKVRNGELDYSGTHYLEVHDSDLLGSILKTAAVAAAVYFGGSALLSSFGTTAAAEAGAVAAGEAGVSAGTAATFGTSGDALGFFTAGTNAAVNTSVADYIAAASAGLETGAATAFTAGLPLANLASSGSGFLSSAWQAAKTAQSVASTSNSIKNLVSGPPKLSPAITPKQNTILPTVLNSGSLLDGNEGEKMVNTARGQSASPAIQMPLIMPADSSSLPIPLLITAGLTALFFMVKK